MILSVDVWEAIKEVFVSAGGPTGGQGRIPLSMFSRALSVGLSKTNVIALAVETKRRNRY